MPEQLNITNLPSSRVEFIDPRTGLMSREWYRFFLNLFTLTGGGNNQTSLDDLQLAPPFVPSTSSGSGTVTSVDVSGGTTGLTASGGPITSSGTITLGGTLAIGSGGTGATSAGSAPFALKGANTDITSVTLTSGTITTAPTSSNDIVNKSYADSIASGINFHAACNYATAAALPANTYNNGTSGVGATLTAVAVGTLTIDGYTFVVGDVGKRILVKNEVTGANNGVYTLTQAGTALLPYILTRATDYDTSGTGTNEIDEGDMVLVLSGTVNANTSWVQQTPLPITVGTTALVFLQFAAVQTYTAGTGLSLITNQFSITNIGTAGTYGSATQTPVLTTNAQGQVTGVTNTTITPAVGSITGFGTGIATFLATPSSANLAAAMTDETGTGALVFATSPTLVTPILGTPQSGNFSTGTFTWPTFNQNTTGSAATLTTGRTISISGDLTYTSPSFNGSANVTAAGTLATVNANVGSFTNASITVNGKGLITAASSGTAPVTSVTGTSPVVSSGGATPAISLATGYGDTQNPYASKTANFFLAAPNGVAGVPTFRAVVAADIPTLNQNTTGTAANITASSNTTLTSLANLATVGTITSGTWSGSFGAVSGANLTNLTAGNLSGTIPTGVLGNSTLYVGTTAIALNRASANLALTGISSVTLPGTTSGTVQIIPAATAGTGTVFTLPATTGTAITSGDTGTVTNTMLAGSIANNKLSNSTITINSTSTALGSSVTLYAGTTTLQTSSANQALTGILSATFPGSTSGSVQLIPTAVAGTGTILTMPATTGTIITTGDTGTVTNTMLAGSIANNKLTNSTISGVALGANLNTLTLATSGTGLSGSTTYNGSAVATFTVTSNATNANTASTIVARDASGNFSAGTITAALSGNATTATSATSSTTSTNVAGGALGSLPYQSAASTTALLAGNTTTTKQFLVQTGTGTVSAAPIWGSITAADVPTLNQNTTGTASNVTGIVAVANGGTGTATPALVAGTNVTITGTWPNQTINSSNPGGTVTSVAATVPSFLSISGSPITSSGTLAISYSGTALPVANGGTGQTTASAAFNALSPITSTGDLIIGNGVNSATRLPIGANNYVLTSNGTTAVWAVASGSGATITNDTTTATNVYPTFAATTSGSLATIYTSNANLLYKPSTGEFLSQQFNAGNGIYVNNKTVSTSYTIATGNSGMSAGPITIASGKTVTVSSGSRWVVL